LADVYLAHPIAEEPASSTGPRRTSLPPSRTAREARVHWAAFLQCRTAARYFGQTGDHLTRAELLRRCMEIADVAALAHQRAKVEREYETALIRPRRPQWTHQRGLSVVSPSTKPADGSQYATMVVAGGRTRVGSARQRGRSLVAVRSPTQVSDPVIGRLSCGDRGAPRGIRTPNRQIRRLVLYVHGVVPSAVGAAQVRCRIQLDRRSPVQ
jgi:hypothetical protein